MGVLYNISTTLPGARNKIVPGCVLKIDYESPIFENRQFAPPVIALNVYGVECRSRLQGDNSDVRTPIQLDSFKYNN